MTKGKIIFQEMTIRIDDLTKDVATFEFTDFADEGEEDGVQLMWDNNIDKLKESYRRIITFH